jgi:hypothetical protein
MIAAYSRINVQLDAPLISVSVNVHKYACQHPGYGTGQVERMQYKDRLLGAIGGGRGIAQNGMTASRFVGVFSGKGTMDDIATCMRLAVRHRVFHHTRTLATDAQLPFQWLLQRVADDYVGLDCNGFVGNWAIYNAVPGASASHFPLDWLSGRAARRTLAEIQPFDVVVWASGNHIGMVETVGNLSTDGSKRSIGFAESSRGGMLLHAGTEISLLRSPTATPRGTAAPFSLHNDIHGNDAVAIVSMARGH